MMPSSIPIPLPDGLNAELPRFIKVRQRFNDERLDDVDAAMAEQFAKFSHIDLKGKSVAIGVGSRGIRPQPPVVRALVRELKAAGAEPFIVPAMGSHGGGTAEGQTWILKDYGITEDYTGAPIKASMDVVTVGTLDDGTPVYCDKLAYEADYLVPCNRVKPHTDFRGKHESGLVKMLAIGMAKHAGAARIHLHGFEHFPEVLPAAAQVFIDNTRMLFAVAMVENAYDKLKHVELVAPEQLIERDAALLEVAKANIPRFMFESIDVLVVNQLGKDISGCGMDPNATGRPSTGLPGFETLPIREIVVLDLTEATHGNATGLSNADVTTRRLVEKMDWSATYVNIVTSGAIGGGKLPIVADTDNMALAIALRGVPRLVPENARIVRVNNTLELSEVWVTEGMREEVEANPDMEIIGEPFDARFDNEGALQAFA
jgi:hypothetical protein